jgi:AraC-like DNA-binding protein
VALARVVAELRRLVRAARSPDALVVTACARLGSPDDARIAALARHLDTSARTLERRFVAEVGLTPKRFARIARVQRSLAALAVPGARAAAVAHAMGYSDQAHFTRELVALAGVRPGEVANAA